MSVDNVQVDVQHDSGMLHFKKPPCGRKNCKILEYFNIFLEFLSYHNN